MVNGGHRDGGWWPASGSLGPGRGGAVFPGAPGPLAAGDAVFVRPLPRIVLRRPAGPANKTVAVEPGVHEYAVGEWRRFRMRRSALAGLSTKLLA